MNIKDFPKGGFCDCQGAKEPRNDRKSAFTLSETLIVLALLGVVAAITIPNLMSRHNQIANKTKIKKAMAIYESVVRNIALTNRLTTTSAIQNQLGENCANAGKYFSIAGKTQNNCVFQTKDGIWWNTTQLERTIVAFKSENLSADIAGDFNDKRAYYLIYSFDDNNRLRINDLEYEYNNDQSWDSGDSIKKLYDDKNMVVTKQCKDDICRYKRGDYKNECVGASRTRCTYCMAQYAGTHEYSICYVFGEKNNSYAAFYHPDYDDTTGKLKKFTEYLYDQNGKTSSGTITYYDVETGNIKQINDIVYENGKLTSEIATLYNVNTGKKTWKYRYNKYLINGSTTNKLMHSESYSAEDDTVITQAVDYTYYDDGTRKSYRYTHYSNGQPINYYEFNYDTDGSTVLYTKYGCDITTDICSSCTSGSQACPQ